MMWAQIFVLAVLFVQCFCHTFGFVRKNRSDPLWMLIVTAAGTYVALFFLMYMAGTFDQIVPSFWE